MPTPLARLLRALGGGRISPQALRQIPKVVLPCTDPTGPDFDAPIRAVLNDLTASELQAYQKHLDECSFCRDMHAQAVEQDLSDLRAICAGLGIEIKPNDTSA